MWARLYKYGEISKEQSQGTSVSVAMMHVALPSHEAERGETMTLDSDCEDIFERKDSNWMSEGVARRLKAGKQITMRIRTPMNENGYSHWYVARVRKIGTELRLWITDSENTAHAAEWWAGATHARATIEEAARTGLPPKANTAHYERHEVAILNGEGRLLSLAQRPGVTTLGQLAREVVPIGGQPPTHVHTNMGAWPAATRLSAFGQFTGVQNTDRGAEGSLVLTATGKEHRGGGERSTTSTETEVWLLKGGETHRTTVKMTAEERQVASIEDWVNQCYPDNWDTIMVLAAGGSEVIEHPDKVTVEEMEAKYGRVHLQAVCRRAEAGVHRQGKCAAMREKAVVSVARVGRHREATLKCAWRAPNRKPTQGIMAKEWPEDTTVGEVALALGTVTRGAKGVTGHAISTYSMAGDAATDHPSLASDRTLIKEGTDGCTQRGDVGRRRHQRRLLLCHGEDGLRLQGAGRAESEGEGHRRQGRPAVRLGVPEGAQREERDTGDQRADDGSGATQRGRVAGGIWRRHAHRHANGGGEAGGLQNAERMQPTRHLLQWERGPGAIPTTP